MKSLCITDLQILYNSLLMDPDRGAAELQRKVQFDIRYYFCRRGCENIYDMTKSTFALAMNPETGIAYVFKCQDEMQKNHKEANNPIITGFMPQILDNITGSPHKMCPVRSYKNYIGHLNERCQYLWQTPNPAAFKRGDPVWYKNKRVGENKISCYMTELSKDANLSRRYTNHCIRVSGTTNLTRAQFSANQIMAVTGHKSVNSLAMYQWVQSDEKLMMGISLASNLFQTPVVQQPQITTAPLDLQLPAPEYDVKPSTCKEIAIPTNTNEPPQDISFDILDFINDANDEEIVLAATQMEKQYMHNQLQETKQMSIIKKSPKKQQMPVFNNCKIGNININVYHK